MFFASPFIEIITYINTGGATPEQYIRNFMPVSFFEYVDRDILPIVFGLMLAVSIIFGLCLAITITGYMHDRKAAIFFNSIPIKKRVLFTTQCLSGIAYFYAPFIIIYLISIALMPAYITFVTITKIFVVCKFVFFFVYSFTILAAALAGTAFNTVVSVVYMAFFASGIFGIVITFVQAFYRFTSTNAIISDVGNLSALPIVYFIGEIAARWRNEFWGFVLVCFLIMFALSIVFLIIGGFLNNIGKTENAEKPFYFKAAYIKFKYILLSMIVTLSGIGFYHINYSIIYMVMGIITGGFIAFLFINFVIYKNIREVFSGFRQFGIFLVAASIVLGLLSYDIFGIDRYLPEASRVESVELDRRNTPVFHYSMFDDLHSHRSMSTQTIKDSEAIELVNNIFRIAMRSRPSPDARIYSSGLMILNGMEIRYNLKNGGSAHKKIPWDLRFDNESDAYEYEKLTEALFANRSFRSGIFAPVTDSVFMAELLDSRNLIGYKIGLYNFTEGYEPYLDVDIGELQKLFEKLNEDILGDNFKMEYHHTHLIDFSITRYTQNRTNTETHDFSIWINENFPRTIEYIEEIFER
jgi:hypothetical protein